MHENGRTEKRGRVRVGTPEALFALWAVFVAVVGRSIYSFHSFSYLITEPERALAKGAIVAVIALSCTAAAQLVASRWGAREVVRHAPEKPRASIRVFCACIAVVLAAAYLLCWLAFYPGALAYDIRVQLLAVAGIDPWSNWIPILHTLILALFVYLGQLLGGGNAWLVLYSLASIALNVATYTYLAYWIVTRGYGRRAAVAVSAVFALDPVFTLMSFNPTKDVLFGCVFVLFILALLDLYLQRDSLCDGRHLPGKLIARALVAGIFACLLRNNAPHSLLLAALVLLVASLIGRGRDAGLARVRRSAAGVCAAPALAVLVATSLLYPALGIVRSPFVEPLSVPLNQMAGALTNLGGPTSPELAAAQRYFPFPAPYNPRFADPAKFSFDDELAQEDLGEFAKTYLRLGRAYPGQYLAIALDLDIGYWYPLADVPDPVADRIYLEIDSYADDEVAYPVHHTNWLPGLRAWYHSVADHTWAPMNLPIIGFAFSTALPSTAMVVLLYVAVRFRKRELLVCLLLGFSYFVAYLIGPVCNFRYVYPIFMLLPLMAVLLREPDRAQSRFGEGE